MEILQVIPGKTQVTIRTDQGNFSFFVVSDRIMRAVYTKRETVEHESLMIESAVYENPMPLKTEESDARVTI